VFAAKDALQSFARELSSNYTLANDPASLSPQSAGIKKQQFLVHKGKSTAMIRRSPSLCGVTLCKGWSDRATQAFCNAIDSIGTWEPVL
jgi:hypothetical protein